MHKRIELNKDRILILDIEKQNHLNMITISEYFGHNSNLLKNYSLSVWDDFSFNAYIPNEDSTNEVSFQFNKDHPLYQSFINLLNGESNLIIDDDFTREINKKYINIYIKDEIIYLKYISNQYENPIAIEKFNVYIKNIFPDGRSKIDQQYKDTKKRLMDFFNKAVNALLEYDKEKIKVFKK